MSPDLTRSQRKRSAVLQAAIAEFQLTGFRDTSMDRIAERAEVSKRTVYNHFPSKEELFRAIVTELLDQAHRAVAVEYDPQRPLCDQLRELGQQEAELIGNRDMLRTTRVVLAEAVRSPDLVESALGTLQTDEDGITRWVRAAAKAGRLNVDSAETAGQQFLSLLKGQLFWPQVFGLCPAPKQAERAAIIESSVRMFLDHYEVRK